MMVDTTVYGWLVDCETFCSACVGVDYWDSNLDRILSDEARPLYSIDDGDDAGLTCDGCFEYIFEPAPEYCFECQDTHTEPEQLEPTCRLHDISGCYGDVRERAEELKLGS